MQVWLIDGCDVNDRFWVFANAATDMAYTLEISDTRTGESVSYSNPLGTLAPAIFDTNALDVCESSCAPEALFCEGTCCDEGQECLPFPNGGAPLGSPSCCDKPCWNDVEQGPFCCSEGGTCIPGLGCV